MSVLEANLTDKEFRQISDLIHRHCGINLHDGKQELVRARIAKCLRTGGFATASDYLEHVLKDPSGKEFADLVDALSTNLTSFFREKQHFDYLIGSFLPALLNRKRATRNHRIRGWSAACSSGEEPYTLAMTLLTALQNQGAWDTKILATDISRKVLKSAIIGFYEASRASGIPSQFKDRFLKATTRDGKSGYEVTADVKEVIRFNYLNLIERWPFTGPFDFVFCRNVMIYFDKPTQESLVNRFWEVLEPGGLLFTGHSESLTGISHKFSYVQPTIYRKG